MRLYFSEVHLSTVWLNEVHGTLARVPVAPLDRRAQIVHVAFQLIAERGLEGLRFGDVARGAGINNGTLLYYFRSKDVLIQAVGAYLVEQFMQTASPPDARGEADPVTQLRWEFVDARQRLGSPVGVVYTELLARAQRDPAVAQLLKDIDANWRGWLTSILERGRARGAFRADIDVDLVATTIMVATRGVGMQALAGGDPASLAPVMDALAERIEAWIAA